MKHKLTIVQTVLTARSTVVEVEADSVEDAVEIQNQLEVPDDAVWTVDHTKFIGEDVGPAQE